MTPALPPRRTGFAATLADVRSDPVIRTYAWSLLASHTIVYLFFLNTGVLNTLFDHVEPLCWPYFENCWQFRLTSTNHMVGLVVAHFGLLVAAAMALAGKHIKTYWVLMIALNVLVFAVVSLDYRLRANEFYMLFWLNFVFLVWPNKRWSVPLIVVSFYWWAGTLKLNYEWLSGAVLYNHLFLIPARFAWAACAYVVCLEMIVIWGLLAKRAWIRWLALAQLALFHLESLSQIHWFYPLLMAAILSWFVLERLVGGATAGAQLQALIRLKAPRSAYAILAFFAGFQLMPFMYRGDKAITGQGRIFALHMFEARQVCDVSATIHDGDDPPRTIDLKMPGLAPRMICDPIVYYDRVQNLCREGATASPARDVDFLMTARRTTDTRMQTIVDELGFCSKHDTYRLFANNTWMK